MDHQVSPFTTHDLFLLIEGSNINLFKFLGTGKTLMARALANECSFGKKKVTFFMRKGADLLSKWVGQTEKQITLLFEQVFFSFNYYLITHDLNELQKLLLSH